MKNDILTYLVQSGKIDLATIEQEMYMQKYIETHPYKIWQGDNGYWYTYIYEADTRKLLKRKTQTLLFASLIKYYKNKEEDPTFKDIFTSWVDDKLLYNEISKGTYDRYLVEYNTHLNNTDFAKCKIRLITEDILEDFIRVTLSKGLKRKAYSNLRTLLIGTFKYAKKKKLTTISISTFFKDLEISKRIFEKTDQKQQVFTEEEVQLITNWISENPEIGYLGVLLDFQTGLRSAELAALKYSDICEDKLHIQRQEIRYKDSYGKDVYEVVNYTKTEAGNRYVYLPESALTTIQKIRRLNPFGEYLFMENGKRLPKYTFNNKLSYICKACGIPKRSMHKIRKTYGTVLIDSGTDDSLIMRQMGHTDISTTRKYYYFANKDDESNRKQIAKAINW